MRGDSQSGGVHSEPFGVASDSRYRDYVIMSNEELGDHIRSQNRVIELMKRRDKFMEDRISHLYKVIDIHQESIEGLTDIVRKLKEESL